MSSLSAASKPSTKYSLQLIGRKLPAPSRLRRSLDSSISSPGSNGAAPAAATRRNASLSSSSTSSAAANDKLNSASTKAAAWVWHQRGVGEPVAPTKRVQRSGSSSSSSSSETSSPTHLPKSRFFAESIKARAAVMPPTALFDAFELSSLRYQMAQLVGRLHEDAPAAEEHQEGEKRLQEHEAGGEAADLHVTKPMEAELQASTKGGAGYPLQRGPKVRHASLDEDAYYEEVERPARIGGSFRSVVSAGAGANQKSHSHSSSSLAKPFSAIHKLFQKISKAVKSPSSRRGDTSQYANVHEGQLDQHYHYHHYHHHHYHHYNYDLEEGCGPDEAFAMARRRRFSDSAGVVVYGGAEARGQAGQAADQGQTSPMTTWGLPAAASSEEAGSPAGCAVPPPSGAAGEPALRSTKSIHSSRLRLPQRKSVKPTSLQLGSQKAAEMVTAAPSATRLRRLSDSLSDRQAALLQLDLARSMKTSCNNNSFSNQAAAPSRRRHSGTFSAVKAY